MITVPLGGGKAAGRVALIDDADASLVLQYSWTLTERKHPNRRTWGPYAYAYLGGGRDNQKRALLHRLLLPGFIEIDHADGNGLNCQRHNLRPATRSQNNANASKRRTYRDGMPTSSRWKGVSRRRDAWRAYIFTDGRQRILGTFADEITAALAYDAAARELFGPFARVNFPELRMPVPPPDPPKMYPHVCEGCSRRFTSARAACRFCSDLCRAAGYYRANRDLVLERQARKRIRSADPVEG